MATSANITYRKLYTIGKSKLCWFQTCANGVGRQSGREDMSKTKMALNPRLRLEVFGVTVKCPSKVGQRKVCSLVRNRNISFFSKPPYVTAIQLKLIILHINNVLKIIQQYYRKIVYTLYTLYKTNTHAGLKRNRLKNREIQLFEYSMVGLYCGST